VIVVSYKLDYQLAMI